MSNLEWALGDVVTATETQPAPHTIPTFSCLCGPTPQTRNASTPLQVFQLFLTALVLESIVQQSKLFASQKGVNLEFRLEELLPFIGLNVTMGMLCLPQIRDYWSTKEVLATPWFSAIMLRDRFLVILRFLHVVDSTLQKKRGDDGHDPLYKVRPLIDHISAVFPKYYQPARHLSVDEMICRVAFLQYLPKKPTRFGIKVWIAICFGFSSIYRCL